MKELEVLLPNQFGRVTAHLLVRLELRGAGCTRGVYPVYQCALSGRERHYGWLHPKITKETMSKLFGPVYIERGSRWPGASKAWVPALAEFGGAA